VGELEDIWGLGVLLSKCSYQSSQFVLDLFLNFTPYTLSNVLYVIPVIPMCLHVIPNSLTFHSINLAIVLLF